MCFFSRFAMLLFIVLPLPYFFLTMVIVADRPQEEEGALEQDRRSLEAAAKFAQGGGSSEEGFRGKGSGRELCARGLLEGGGRRESPPPDVNVMAARI